MLTEGILGHPHNHHPVLGLQSLEHFGKGLLESFAIRLNMHTHTHTHHCSVLHLGCALNSEHLVSLGDLLHEAHFTVTNVHY